MDAYEKKTGDRVFAIPHNGNLSNGRMVALTDFEGRPLDEGYTKRRQRWEERFQWVLGLALLCLCLEPLISERQRRGGLSNG